MRNSTTLFIAALLVLSPIALGAQDTATQQTSNDTKTAKETEGKDLRERFKQYVDDLKTDKEYSEQAMKLVDLSGPQPITKVRRTKTFQLNLGEGKNRQMIVFTEPRTVKGTTLLSWTHPEDPADQWIYLPEIGNIERVVTSGKGEYFMGTDFTYADLRPDDPDNYNFEELKESMSCRQWTCTKVAVYPKSDTVAERTGYSKRVFRMRDDINVPVRVTFYDRDGELLKQLRLFEFEEVTPGVHRPMKQAMVHKQREHRTLISVNKWTEDVDFAVSLFTKTAVRQERPLRFSP